MNGDVNGYGGGTGAGTRTNVEANERTPNESGDGSGNGAGTGTGTWVESCRGTQLLYENGDGSERETRAVAEIRTGPRMGTATGTRTRSGRTEKRRISARNRLSLADAISPFHSARVIISADRGWRLRAPDSSVRIARCLYTYIEPRG